jgi:ankyrin repeat protein
LVILLLGTVCVQAISEKDQQLIDAAEKGDIKKVKALIKAGADVNAKDKEGGTALMYAKNEGHGDIVKILKAAGAN